MSPTSARPFVRATDRPAAGRPGRRPQLCRALRLRRRGRHRPRADEADPGGPGATRGAGGGRRSARGARPRHPGVRPGRSPRLGDPHGAGRPDPRWWHRLADAQVRADGRPAAVGRDGHRGRGRSEGQRQPRTPTCSGVFAAAAETSAIVTRFELRLHAVGPMVHSGLLLWPLEQGRGGGAPLPRLGGVGPGRADHRADHAAGADGGRGAGARCGGSRRSWSRPAGWGRPIARRTVLEPMRARRARSGRPQRGAVRSSSTRRCSTPTSPTACGSLQGHQRRQADR